MFLLSKKITIPLNRRQRFKPIDKLNIGTSFLLNPEPLFKDKSVDFIQKAQYIKLAGRRSYTDYKLYRNANLDLTMFPDVILSNIQFNPLLTIQDTQLKFKYEFIH